MSVRPFFMQNVQVTNNRLSDFSDARYQATAFTTPDGTFVAFGRTSSTSSLYTIYLYNESTDTWTAKTSMPTAGNGTVGHAAVCSKWYQLLNVDSTYRVMFFTYSSGGSCARMEYNTTNDTWTKIETFNDTASVGDARVAYPFNQWMASSIYLDLPYDGQYLTISCGIGALSSYDGGGSWTSGSSEYATLHLFNDDGHFVYSTGTIVYSSPVGVTHPSARVNAVACYNPDGSDWSLSNNLSYVGLGRNNTTYYTDFYQRKQYSDSHVSYWEEKTSFPGSGREGAVSFYYGGLYYVGLGRNASTIFNDMYAYDASTNTWTRKTDFAESWYDAVATVTSSGKILIGLGNASGGAAGRFYSYVPADY